MAAIVSLDAFRRRKAQTRQASARARAGLSELVRETPAPCCAVCGRPIVVAALRDPAEGRALLRLLLDEGLCACCYAPF